ncbi:hypothetical protein KC887_06760, partial [Candidatus Kaiserbacteria bacterium]|nr:hypothetical protein [Candidatus Kaiserbacteria bacterium]
MALIQPKTGFHTGSSGGNLDGITADYIIPVLHSGKDVMIVAADTTAGLYDACVAAKNYQNTKSTLCWRRTDQHKNGGFDFDALANNFSLSPEQNAELHWRAYQQEIPPELVQYKDILELIILNEIRGQNTDEPVYDNLHIGEYLGRFALHYRTLTDWRLLFFGFAAGEPDIDVWEQPSMLNFLRLCGERPHDTGIALHEYSYTISDILDGYPYKIGRYQFLHDVCDDNGIPRPRIVISEWGWALDDAPAVPQAMADIETVYREYAKHPNIVGGAIWWLGPDFGGIANKIQPLIKPLGEYIIATNYDVEIDTPQPPDGGEGEPVTKYKYLGAAMFDLITDKVVTDITEPVQETHDRILFHDIDTNGNWVFISSTDYIPIPPNAKRVSLGRYHGYEDETENPNPPDPQPPPDLPYLDVYPLSQRDPVWANAVLGEPTGHGKTIGNWGCLLVAYNMLARYWNITDRFPGAENAHYVSVGAFSNQYIQPAALRTAYPNQVAYDGYLTRDSSAMRPKIREWIDNGWPVACRVDFIPSTAQWDQHWVLVNGYIGDTDFYMADPWHGDITIVNDRYPIAGSDILEAIFYWPKGETKPPDPPTPPPTGTTYDILDYMVGTHRQQHTLQYTWAGGGTQTIQIVQDGNEWRYVKGGGQYEQLYYDDNWIYRAEDTSESADRFYTQSTNGTLGAAWVKRRMAIGETVFTEKQVQHYLKDGCVPQNGGLVTDALKLTAVYPAYTFDSGIVLKDVIRLEWAAGEGYLFAKGYGLVGFEFSGGKSYISELALQGRDDLPVNVPS